MDLFAQAAFRTNTKAISNYQHANHQFRIDGRAARGTVIITQMFANAGETGKPIDGAEKMIVGNMLLQAEAVKQSLLSRHPFTHHRSVSLINPNELNQDKSPISRSSFSTESAISGPTLGLGGELYS